MIERLTTRPYPIPDRKAARALGSALRDLDYTEEAICRLLGDECYEGGRENAPLHERREAA